MNWPQRRARRLFGRAAGRPTGTVPTSDERTPALEDQPPASGNGASADGHGENPPAPETAADDSPTAANDSATTDDSPVTDDAATDDSPVVDEPAADDSPAPDEPPVVESTATTEETARVDGDGASHTALVPTAVARPAAIAPPPPNPLEAMRRFWPLIAVLTLLGAGGGVAAGLLRDPEHTAESRLSVGRVDVATQSISGWATASQILADSYSRAIVADRVIAQVRRRTGVSTRRYLDHVKSSPIASSGVILIEATSGSERQALALANESARALTQYVRSLNRSNPESQRLFVRYRAASQAYGRAIARRARLGGDETDAIIRAEAVLQQARLRLGTIENLYRLSEVGQASPNSLQVLAYAAATQTDRDSVLQRLVFAGTVGGLVLGSLLALLLARAGARRARRRATAA